MPLTELMLLWTCSGRRLARPTQEQNVDNERGAVLVAPRLANIVDAVYASELQIQLRKSQ